MQDGFKLDKLNAPGVTLTCRRGASSCTNLAEVFPKATLRQFDDDSAIVQEVLNGNAQAFGASEPLPSRATAENPGKLFTPLSQDQELNRLPSGMAVRKGDVDTLNFLDNWIGVNTKFFQQRRHYWFETQDWRAQVQAN